MIAAIALVVAAGLFAAAFIAFDGSQVAGDLWSQVANLGADDARRAVGEPTPVTRDDLLLPEGMPEEFALRLWQEQIESQRVITQLVNGEVVSLVVTDVERGDEEAKLSATITLKDGTTVPGVIGLRKYAGSWFISYASAQRNGEIAEAPKTRLPAVSDVDVELLNTIIAEQTKSKAVTQDYVDGKIRSVSIRGVTMGPNTATIGLELNEESEEGYADFVALKKQVDGEDVWFLARFNETGTSAQQ